MKQIILVLAVGMCCFACISCSFFGSLNTPNYSPSIVDDETRMLQTGDSYFYKSRSIDSSDEQADCSFTSFSGLETLYVLECEMCEQITISINASVDTNRFKVVLVNHTQQEVVTLSQGTNQSRKTVSLQAGRFSLKLVGYDATGSATVILDVGQGVMVSARASS